MTVHVVGFPHTRFDDTAFSHCAYTAKVVRWVEMMGNLGENITVYWGGDEPVNTAGVATYVPVLTDEDQRARFGDDLAATILYLDWNPDTSHWRQLNHRVAAELYTRWRDGDLIAVLSGSNHDGLMHEWEPATFIEPWVGYMGISSKTKAKAFESSAWRHCMYGHHRIEDGNPLDTVIPNFYRPDDFRTAEDDGYLLYIGRITRRKGVADAVEIARQVGRPLVVAGQGGAVDGHEFTGDGGALRMDIDGLVGFDYVGVIGPTRRADLFSNAACSLVPTLYVEPFGGVFAEAMLSGIVPVCRDWGAFVEYSPDEARFSTVDQGVKAVEWAIEHRGLDWRKYAIGRFGMDTVAKQFSEWMSRIRGQV